MKERKQQAKRPGAPLGNQNARKHGYYSRVPTPVQRRAYAKASREADLEDEIALLRAKINTIIKVAPENFGVLLKALSALIRAVKASRPPVKHAKESPDELKQILVDVIAELEDEFADGNAEGNGNAVNSGFAETNSPKAL